MKPNDLTHPRRIENAMALTTSYLLRDNRLRQAVAYLGPTFLVRATRQRKPDGRDRRETFLVSVGSPNYYERRFIAQCRKAGEPFPVKKVQLKFYKEAK